MTPPLTPRPDRPLEPTAAAKTTSTQLFGVFYITLTGLVDSVVPNSGPWSLLGQSLSYIIKLAPILWWALPAGLTTPHPEPPNASTYDWLPDIRSLLNLVVFSKSLNIQDHYQVFQKLPTAPCQFLLVRPEIALKDLEFSGDYYYDPPCFKFFGVFPGSFLVTPLVIFSRFMVLNLLFCSPCGRQSI
ncbi:hypothetical protein DSO57_1037057 [Entomophthora muscae]|uniref:Uncharacterized protein n=1 Tax=Entomophthora muscae TaxID=34485 RepID=A0ACC2RE63_9FUNG|nr:hypothetical protein DSO57_1037057 [Entomophthora muscae]